MINISIVSDGKRFIDAMLLAVPEWEAVMMSKVSVHKAISRMTKRIVRKFHPEKIILFGSHARGEAGPDSDVDLLVVLSGIGSRRDAEIEIGVALHQFRIPKDIVVTTPEDFEWRKEIPGTVERPAALEGKVLYART